MRNQKPQVGSEITILFSVDNVEMPQEVHSCSYPLAYGKIGVLACHFA